MLSPRDRYSAAVLREIPWTFLRGFFMGSADIVPGVSGGTIALLVGIYERLVSSVRAGSSAIGALARGDRSGLLTWLRRVEWLFIIPLAAGILTAILLLAGILERLLEERPVEMAAAFSGLVLASIVVAWTMVRVWTPVRYGIAGVVTVATFVVMGLGVGDPIESPSLIVFFLSGALAACAMILPGISGSFVLVLIGIYGPVLSAVDDRELVVLGVVALGVLTGLALFSQVLDRALHRHHDSMVAALIGLMAGSFRILWPWPDGLESTELGAPDGAVGASIVLAAAAFGLVLAISILARRIDARQPSTTA